MKTHKVLFLALLVSAVFAVSAQAGNRNRNGGNAQAVRSSSAHYSGGAIHSNSYARYGGNRTMGVRSMPTSFRQRSSFNPGGNVASFNQRQFTPRTFNRSNRFARFQNNRNLGAIQGPGGGRLSNINRNFNRTGRSRFGNNNRGFNRVGTGQHVFARRSANWNRNWNRHSDHWWNGHRCRFVNGSWFIFDLGFIPWYGWSYYDSYYPYSYGAYGYDPGVYDQSATYDQGGYNNYNGQSNYYDQGDSKSYDQGANGSGYNERATVVYVQDQLARAGYYRGKIDGVLGPETRHALLSYQSAKGLHITGSLTPETEQSLGLTGQGGDLITDQ